VNVIRHYDNFFHLTGLLFHAGIIPFPRHDFPVSIQPHFIFNDLSEQLSAVVRACLCMRNILYGAIANASQRQIRNSRGPVMSDKLMNLDRRSRPHGCYVHTGHPSVENCVADLELVKKIIADKMSFMERLPEEFKPKEL
jgi:hypothetical protein